MEKALNIAKLAGALIVILLMIGFGIKSSKGMPENAQLYVDDSTKTYIAPPCIETPTDFSLATAGASRRMGYRSDSKCRDEGVFMQDDRSLTGMLLQKIGVLTPIPSRWNEDRSWNY